MRTLLAAALSLALASPVVLASDQSLQLSRVKLPEAKTAAAAVAKKHDAKRADPGLLLMQMMAFLAASQGQVAPGAAPDTANATQ
ncbi:hypothetical protein [Atopomonas sediminilitoris]|uniref:hypothetical protein n=1 Tax=Atopomonas sediminilitoris TaxID=2919919 RepID=UPI001F4E109D|nr:hypothetical protein [Atopomonas sediminilitoris]MCJ8169891.1 hypothetical protein [Atopomonas sediminilitoris]